MASWSAKALLITAGVFLVGGAIWYARSATVPLIVAALVSTQLLPLVAWATRRGAPRWLAVAGCMIGVLIIAAGVTWVFASSLFGNLSEIGSDISAGANKAVNWLRDNNDWAKQHEDEIRSFLKDILPAAKDAAGGLFGAVLGGLSFTAQMVSGAVLMFVFLLYLLTGGDEVWGWITNRFAETRRDRVATAGAAAWSAATGYIRGIALVALIDTTVITLGMLVVGTPHVGTLALLTFVSLFIPILGAWVSGLVIGLVTLGSDGVHGRAGNWRGDPRRAAARQHVRNPARLPADRQPAPDRHADVLSSAPSCSASWGRFSRCRWSPSAGPSTTRSSSPSRGSHRRRPTRRAFHKADARTFPFFFFFFFFF